MSKLNQDGVGDQNLPNRKDQLELIQVVREMHPFGGTSGVAWALKGAFDELGVRNNTLTLAHFGLKAGREGKNKYKDILRLLRDVLAFTFLGSFALGARQGDRVYIVHGDPIGGDIFVNHGLHRAVVASNPKILLRNPIHIFLYARESLRHRLQLYRRVVCLSAGGVDELMVHYPSIDRSRVAIIPNGVNLERFFPIERPPRTALDSFRLVFVGHEFERKGLALVIDALACLPARVTLTVVGGSELEIEAYGARAAAKGVNERVEFLGRRSDVPEILQVCDLFVLPSAVEAWGLVYIEAMACGVPVLMTPVASAQEIVGDGLGGLLIQRTVEGVKDGVLKVLSDPFLFERLRRGAIQNAAQYPWRRIGEKYVELARAVIAERSSK
jgi:UDP-glucose:(heptosyl)LPS alpha-1,3-glucosyltransferase